MAPINLVKIVDITKHKWEIVGLLQEFDIVPQEKTCANGHSMHLCISEDPKCKRYRWRCKLRSFRSEVRIRTKNWLLFDLPISIIRKLWGAIIGKVGGSIMGKDWGGGLYIF